MGQHAFRAVLWEHAPGDPGSWHFVTLPPDVAEDVAEDVACEAGPRTGFGSVRVRARLGSTAWQTSLFPDRASGGFLLPVKAAVRRTLGLQAGDELEVVLEVGDDLDRPG